MNIKDNLKKFRMKKGESQKEVAKNTNIPYANYNKYETTITTPDIDTLILLANYYKITLDELVGHEVPYLINKSDFNEVQLAIIEELKTLNIEQSYMLLAYIDGIKQGQEKRNQIIEKINKKGEN